MASPIQEVKPKLYILYGSQTGQAESIANEIYEEGVFKSQDVSLFCLKDFEKEFDISKIQLAIFVCSTTGDGEPPENARKFLRSISKTPANHLARLRFTLLGLGDSNYSTFCGGPKRLQKALKKNGANTFYKAAFADDGTDMEIEVEPWLEGLWESVEAQYKAFSDSNGDYNGLGSNTDTILPDIAAGNMEIKSIDIDENTTDKDDVKNVEIGVQIKNTGIKTINNEVSDDTRNILSDIKGLSLKRNETFSAVIEMENQIQNTLTTNPPLRHSTELSNIDLTLPPLGKIHLELHFHEEMNENLENEYQNAAKFPLQTGPTISANLVTARQLTTNNAVKRALEIGIENKSNIEYQPGDSIGICTENSPTEVEWLIKRLNLEKLADTTASLTLIESNTKKKVPDYISPYFTLREIFSACIAIRSVPKKPLIRLLSECASNDQEKRRLQELCSRQGASHYTEHMRIPAVCILDLLAVFPSCMPDCATLIQYLPRLQPRRYSLISSPLYPNLKFVFNVVEFGTDNGLAFKRKGVCTAYMEKLVTPILNRSKNINNEKLRIFSVPSTGFCLPTNDEVPIVMIGPGTGVAPLIGFLNHRNMLKKSKPDLKFGESWLFFGCRHKDRDYLYKDELNALIDDGTLSNLFVSFSRDVDTPNQPKYVQDNIRLRSRDVVRLLLEENAVFYVCGDARNMAKDVRSCLLQLIADETDCDDVTAGERFKKVVEEKRYREDIWT